MDELEPTPSGLDWRILFGLSITTIWIGGGLIYLAVIVGWDNFLSLPTADIGSFFEGAFAPLAFLWLVIGHFMQQKEITANTRAITMQERSTRRLELHSRRDSYFKLLTLVQEQLGSIAAFHFISVFGDTGTGEIGYEEYSVLRADMSRGDFALFVRRMTAAAVSRRGDADALQDLLFGTEIRCRHSNNFINTFQQLLAAADGVDAEGMVRAALLDGSSYGVYYRVLLEVSGRETPPSFIGQPLMPNNINTNTNTNTNTNAEDNTDATPPGAGEPESRLAS